MHFHDLRYRAVTILVAAVNIKVIQELLEHTDIANTLRVYGHLLPSTQREVVEKLEDVFRLKNAKEKD